MCCACVAQTVGSTSDARACARLRRRLLSTAPGRFRLRATKATKLIQKKDCTYVGRCIVIFNLVALQQPPLLQVHWISIAARFQASAQRISESICLTIAVPVTNANPTCVPDVDAQRSRVRCDNYLETVFALVHIWPETNYGKSRDDLELIKPGWGSPRKIRNCKLHPKTEKAS